MRWTLQGNLAKYPEWDPGTKKEYEAKTRKMELKSGVCNYAHEKLLLIAL